MVFIQSARVSEIPAPHKFDRSINIVQFSIDRLEIGSIDFPAILNIQLFMHFHLKITIFLLMSWKNAKTPKLTKTLENNNAKGLTSVN
jgi:hypothetical protein